MLQKYEFSTNTTQETFMLGQYLSAHVFPSLVISLSGDLGAGKTTITRGIVQGLGGRHVKSPSFTLINEYRTTPPVAHVDLYRLNSAEADSLGLEEFLENGFILIIEWADRLPAPQGSEIIDIRISHEQFFDGELADLSYEMKRRITISATGKMASQAVERLEAAWHEKSEGGQR